MYKLLVRLSLLRPPFHHDWSSSLLWLPLNHGRSPSPSPLRPPLNHNGFLTSHVDIPLPSGLAHLAAQLVRRVHLGSFVLADYAGAASAHEARSSSSSSPVQARAAGAAPVLLAAAAAATTNAVCDGLAARVVVGLVRGGTAAAAARGGAVAELGAGPGRLRLDLLVRGRLGDYVLEELEVVRVRDGAGEVLVLDVAARLAVGARHVQALRGEVLDEHLLGFWAHVSWLVFRDVGWEKKGMGKGERGNAQ